MLNDKHTLTCHSISFARHLWDFESIIGFYTQQIPGFLVYQLPFIPPQQKVPFMVNYRHYTATISRNTVPHHATYSWTQNNLRNLDEYELQESKIVSGNNYNPTGKCTWNFFFLKVLLCEITNSWVLRTLHVCIPKSQKHAKNIFLRKSLDDLTLQIDLSLGKTNNFEFSMIHRKRRFQHYHTSFSNFIKLVRFWDSKRQDVFWRGKQRSGRQQFGFQTFHAKYCLPFPFCCSLYIPKSGHERSYWLLENTRK